MAENERKDVTSRSTGASQAQAQPPIIEPPDRREPREPQPEPEPEPAAADEDDDEESIFETILEGVLDCMTDDSSKDVVGTSALHTLRAALVTQAVVAEAEVSSDAAWPAIFREFLRAGEMMRDADTAQRRSADTFAQAARIALPVILDIVAQHGGHELIVSWLQSRFSAPADAAEPQG